MDDDSHWSSFVSSSNQGLDCLCGDGPCSCPWKSVIEGVLEPSSSAGRCLLHDKTHYPNEAPYLFYRKLTSRDFLYIPGRKFRDPDNLSKASFEVRRDKLMASSRPIPLELMLLCCLDTQNEMKLNQQRELLEICGCLCIHTVGTRQSEKRQRAPSGVIEVATQSDLRRCARPGCRSLALHSGDICAAHRDIKTVQDMLEAWISRSPLIASPGTGDLCYWCLFEGERPHPGDIVAVLNGVVRKDTSQFSFLSVVPQQPWVEINRPQNLADYETHVRVAYLGHAVVTVSSLPADFDLTKPYSIYPSGLNDGRGKLLPLNSEPRAVGLLNGPPEQSEDGQAWSVPVLVSINDRPQLPPPVGRIFGHHGLKLNPFPSDKRFDRSEFVLSLLSEVQALVSLDNTSKSASLLILHGPAGVGKSSVAVELSTLEQIPTLFPSGVWTWGFDTPPAQGHSEKDLLSALQALLKCLSSSLKHHELPDTVKGCSAWLSQLAEASKLLILLDNLWFDEQLEPFLNVGSSCLLLVTSRNAKIGEPSKATCYREIPTLDLLSATQFFLIYSGSGVASDDLVPTIVSYCGGLPLALRVTGAMVGRHLGSLQQIVTIFENHHLSHLHMKDRKDKFVFMALDISVQRLDTDDRAKFLELAAFSSFEHGRGKVSQATLGHFWGLSDYDFQLFLDELESRSLLSLTTTQSGTPYVHLHDIMNEYLLESTPERQPLHRQLVEHWRRLMPVHEGPTDWLRYPVPRDSYYFQYLAAHLRSASTGEFDALEANDAFLALSALVSQLNLGLYVEVFPRLFRNSSGIAATVRQLLPLLSLDEKKRLCAVASGKCPGSDEIEAIRLTLMPEISAEYGQHNSHYSQDRSHYDKQLEEMKTRQGCDPLQTMENLASSSYSTPLPEDAPAPKVTDAPFVPPKFLPSRGPLDPQVVLLVAEAHKKIRTNEVDAGAQLFYRLALMNIPEGMFNWAYHLTNVKPDASAEIEFWYARAAACNPWIVKRRTPVPGVREALHGLGLRRAVAGKIQEANDFYRQAIKQRFSLSQNNMGLLSLHGVSMQKDPIEGALLIQDSAIQNNNEAMVNLAMIYAGLLPGFGIDVKKASMWTDAAERNGIDRRSPTLAAVRDRLELLQSIPEPSQSTLFVGLSELSNSQTTKTPTIQTAWNMQKLMQDALLSPFTYPFVLSQIFFQTELIETSQIQAFEERLRVAADVKRRASIGWLAYHPPHLKEAVDKLLSSVDPVVACNAAIIYLEKFDGLVDSIAYLRDCIRRFPDELFFRRRLAHYLCLTGPLKNLAEAAELYRSLIQKDDFLDDLYHLGVVYFQMENGPENAREESESLFARFLARAPLDHRSRPLVFQFLAKWEFMTQGKNSLEEPPIRQKIADLLQQSDAAARQVHPEWMREDLPGVSLIRQIVSADSVPFSLKPQHGWTPRRIPPSRQWLVCRLNEDVILRTKFEDLSEFPELSHFVSITTPAPRSAAFSSSAAEASSSPISLEEMMALREDHIYQNQVFHGIVGSLVAKSANSVYFIALDVDNHLAIELYIYPKTTKLRTQLPIGTRFLLINPYFRLAADGTEILRVDDDRTIKIQSTAPSCWLCFKQLEPSSSESITCSNCFVACYCSKTCRGLDLSKLLHAKICPCLITSCGSAASSSNHGNPPAGSKRGSTKTRSNRRGKAATPPIGSQPGSSTDSRSRPSPAAAAAAGTPLRAIKPLQAGELLFKETPLLTFSGEFSDFWKRFQAAPERLKDTILSLPTPDLDPSLPQVQRSAAFIRKLVDARPGGNPQTEPLLLQLHLILESNAHSFIGPQPETVVCIGKAPPTQVALFETASKLSHSCIPNCMVTTKQEPGTLSCIALKDIAEGEPLTISFLSSTARTPRQSRHSQLFDLRSIRCDCIRCLGPDDCRPLRCASATCTGFLFQLPGPSGAWRCCLCDQTDVRLGLSVERAFQARLGALEEVSSSGRTFESVFGQLDPRELFVSLIQEISQRLAPTHHLILSALDLLSQWSAGAKHDCIQTFPNISSKKALPMRSGGKLTLALTLQCSGFASASFVFLQECIAAGCTTGIGCEKQHPAQSDGFQMAFFAVSDFLELLNHQPKKSSHELALALHLASKYLHLFRWHYGDSDSDVLKISRFLDRRGSPIKPAPIPVPDFPVKTFEWQSTVCANPRCFEKMKLRCSRCKAMGYCSQYCQKADWQEHKIGCSPPAGTHG